jgi:hypothetical protein
MSDGEYFDEYNTDDNSSLESSSSYAADSQHHWKASENERDSRESLIKRTRHVSV